MIFSALLLAALPALSAPSFVAVQGSGFALDGKPYRFVGTNFWYGLNLASAGPGGDRARLGRELDRLAALGVTNLRIMGASEGPDTIPGRMVPSLQPKPGRYNKAVLDGLDWLISEMGRRRMKAVVVLNNFWPWSGGMSQYLVWSGKGPIPYPPRWAEYQKYTAAFYSDLKSKKRFEAFLKVIIRRKNKYTGLAYNEDPAIMAWELANEPRGDWNAVAMDRWLHETASLIKKWAPRQLVTTGCEGETASPESAGVDFVENHAGPAIDYATMHIWVQNWGWYDPKDAATFGPAEDDMQAYFREHAAMAARLGKPLVLEEFGLARDSETFAPGSSTSWRDQYYSDVFEAVRVSAASSAPVAGVDFWAWSGEGRPPRPGGSWKPGDPWLGDPPHEPQGWYGVYDSDAGTLRAISAAAAKLK
jgi:mannan endo-1,4-beta-mannosidase